MISVDRRIKNVKFEHKYKNEDKFWSLETKWYNICYLA